MKIKSVRIENFRAYRDETVHLNDYTCIVGANGVGKSTILTALNVFFRDQSGASTNVAHLDEEDFHKKDTSRPVRITVTFHELSQEAQQDFKDYYRQGELIISSVAEWNPDLRKAEVCQFGQRRVMKKFKRFMKKYEENEQVSELKNVYKALRAEISELEDVRTKKGMHDELRRYETEHPELCEPLQSRDQFYGITKGANRLQKYIHWLYLPAVKDAAAEQVESKKSALSVLLERTLQTIDAFDAPLSELRREMQEKYRSILKERQGLLTTLTTALDARFKKLVQSDAYLQVEWLDSPEEYVNIQAPVARIIAGESRFSGGLARFGHGLQRSFLIALLQELASRQDQSKPALVLGCEEPELYQHPAQAKHLARILQTLSKSSYQVLVCTHSPYFVSAQGFEDIRVVRRGASEQQAYVSSASISQVSSSVGAASTNKQTRSRNSTLVKLEQMLQPSLNEMFFSDVIVLVEGPEDVACITTYLELMGLYDDFARLGCHFVPTGGKSKLIEPLVVAKSLQIPVFVVFDGDGHELQAGPRSKHEKDNRELLRICSSAGIEPFPGETFWAFDHVMWKTEIQGVVEDEIGTDAWREIKSAVSQEYSIQIPKVDKHSLFILYCLTHAWERGCRVPSLERLCKAICAFAASATGRHPPEHGQGGVKAQDKGASVVGV
jgi:putative ATP-dependent endonuclease of the OLD family